MHTINLHLFILSTLTFIVACAVNLHACMFNHYKNQFENHARESLYSNSAVISGVVAVDEGTTLSILANLDQLRLIRTQYCHTLPCLFTLSSEIDEG